MHANTIHDVGSGYERQEEHQIIGVAAATVIALILIAAFFLLWPL